MADVNGIKNRLGADAAQGLAGDLLAGGEKLLCALLI